MGLREEVRELLRTGNVSRLERLAASDRRVMRHLLGRLWDPDEEVRRSAAEGVGAAAGAHRDLGIDVIRRLIWALNDESATNGVYAVAALGEIGARDPELMEQFVGPLASYVWDDGLREEILKALIRIASVAPTLIAPYLELLEPHIDDQQPKERELATTLWSLIKGEHDQA
jgi:hypothetical protein